MCEDINPKISDCLFVGS